MAASRTLIRLCSKSALYVGLPMGFLPVTAIIFFIIYFLDQFTFILPEEYMIASACTLGVLLLVYLGRLFWKSGWRIKNYLDKDYPSLKASFLLSLHVFFRFFAMVAFLFLLGYLLYFWQVNQLKNIYPEQIAIGLGLIFTAFAGITFLATFTTGIITMLVARIITTAANADLSLLEYAQ